MAAFIPSSQMCSAHQTGLNRRCPKALLVSRETVCSLPQDRSRHSRSPGAFLLKTGRNDLGRFRWGLSRQTGVRRSRNVGNSKVGQLASTPADLSDNSHRLEKITIVSAKGTATTDGQSSWGAKDVLGEDYLYRLGKESDNLNITVGAKEGVIDSLFIGDFLGKESDIVFKYRQNVTRSFEHIQGDYYIAPSFMETVVTFLTKNYLAEQLKCPVPLILGVWGGKGQGKSFQVELIFKALGVEPVILSAGEMESEWAGEPGKLIRERYRAASQVVKNKGKLSCLVINDLDAGIGRFVNTQVTVNNQMVFGTLMNLCDNPTRVSVGQDWRSADTVNRVPIIVTGNDFSTLWAPLIRDGRMDKFYWKPTRDEIVSIVHQMYKKDGLSKEDIADLVDAFPNQPLDFYGALRSRTYDEKVREWVESVGGPEKMGPLLVKRGQVEGWHPPTIDPPKQNVRDLMEAGQSLVEEQEKVMELKLSDEYMKKQVGGGGLVGFGS